MTVEVLPPLARRRAQRLGLIWEERPGLLGWLTTVDHKRIGLLYLITTSVFLGLGGLEALAMRVQLAVPRAHVIGPKTAHAYEPNAKKEVDRRIDAIAARGRDALPKVVKFQTYTLRYNTSYWVTVDRLEKHWERADCDSDLAGTVTTKNVAAFELNLPYAAGRLRSD